MSLTQSGWIALAIAIGFWSSFSAVAVLSHASALVGWIRRGWLCLAALAFGFGVWTTHFVAMVAETSGRDVSYALRPTVLSLMVAVVGVLPAFAMVLSAPRSVRVRIGAGTLVAAAVSAMHFTGMSAIWSARVSYRPMNVVGAVALGVIFAVLALWQINKIHRVRGQIKTAVLLMCCIAAIHFVAMAGTTFSQVLIPLGSDQLIGRDVTLASAGACVFAVAIIFTITLMRQRWRRIHLEAERLRQLADCTIEGLLIHRRGRAVWGNSALYAVTGIPAGTIAGYDAALIATQETRGVLERHLEAPSDSVDEIVVLRPDGTERIAEILSRSIQYDGLDAGIIAVRDITDSRRAEAQISRLAYYDPLTGLGNRTLFNERIDHAINDAVVSRRPLALLVIDLDRIKSVNELYGHPFGDQLFQYVAARLSRTVRRNDTVVRLGGDEFAIIQPYAEQPGAAAGLAMRIVQAMARPFEINDVKVSIGASIGVALSGENASTPKALLQAADLALGRAKREGRNTFCFFEAAMDIKFRERRLLEHDLRHALERAQLTVDYQPLVECSSMRVSGFEALVRWQHDSLGSIAPDDFIPIAEETFLIMQLGRFVLQQACETALTWPDDFTLAVNISPIQFSDPNLADDIIEIIDRLAFPAARLELEVTESVLIEDADRALAALGKLKTRGARIVLDDFGTGYSSLSMLGRFPFDKLKIDRSFVQDLSENGDSEAIVRAILALGKSLNMVVAAEGVENLAQLDVLKAAGCHLVQGFLLGRPTTCPLDAVAA